MPTSRINLKPALRRLLRKSVWVRRHITVWYGKLEDAEQFMDLRYWLAQSNDAKFSAAGDMVVGAHATKGEDLSESRLQRSVASLQRREGWISHRGRLRAVLSETNHV